MHFYGHFGGDGRSPFRRPSRCHCMLAATYHAPPPAARRRGANYNARTSQRACFAAARTQALSSGTHASGQNFATLCAASWVRRLSKAALHSGTGLITLPPFIVRLASVCRAWRKKRARMATLPSPALRTLPCARPVAWSCTALHLRWFAFYHSSVRCKRATRRFRQLACVALVVCTCCGRPVGVRARVPAGSW